MVNPMAGGDEILGRCFVDVLNILLRIAVDQRKPSALDLDHDSMSGFESVVNILQRDFDGGDFIRLEWFGGNEAVAEPSSEYLATDHELVSGEIDSLGSTRQLRMIVWEDVN